MWSSVLRISISLNHASFFFSACRFGNSYFVLSSIVFFNWSLLRWITMMKTDFPLSIHMLRKLEPKMCNCNYVVYEMCTKKFDGGLDGSRQKRILKRKNSSDSDQFYSEKIWMKCARLWMIFIPYTKHIKPTDELHSHIHWIEFCSHWSDWKICKLTLQKQTLERSSCLSFFFWSNLCEPKCWWIKLLHCQLYILLLCHRQRVYFCKFNAACGTMKWLRINYKRITFKIECTLPSTHISPDNARL